VVLERNKRLAEALGLARQKEKDAQTIHVQAASARSDLLAYQVEMLKPSYPRELLSWASQNRSEVSKLEGRFHAFINDEKETFLNLRPMPPETRKKVHLLAEIYKLKTSSYDPEPKRFIMVTKTRDSQVGWMKVHNVLYLIILTWTTPTIYTTGASADPDGGLTRVPTCAQAQGSECSPAPALSSGYCSAC